MIRKEFLSQLGIGAAVLLLPACLGTLSGCSSLDDSFPAPPINLDFTVDVSTGALSINGGFLVKDGVIIGRTTADGIVVNGPASKSLVVYNTTLTNTSLRVFSS